MRALPWLVVALTVAAPAAAHADDPATDNDEDGAFVPLPKRSAGFGLLIHGSRIGGDTESGVGPYIEYALGRDRWQYVGEASLSTTSRNLPSAPSDAMAVGGKMVHGALGVRWLARQFRPDEGGGIELFLTSMLGGQRFYFADGGRLSRPELAVGFGLQVRTYKRPRLGFHLDARIVFTPNDRESSLVRCAGSCEMEKGASTGFMSGFGLTW